MPTVADPSVEALARLFREHPAWQRAAKRLEASATSTVYFSHLPGDAWHLARTAAGSELRHGTPRDPDFVFRFTPDSIERLAAVSGGIGELAVELFTRMTDVDPRARVDIRIAASVPRLLQRGYVKLLLAGGPGVVSFGARHGILGLGALRRFVAQLRAREPADWEA
jgi:hypothetical protein